MYLFLTLYQTNYLKIYPTDLRQNFSFGRTMDVDDHRELSFSIHQETLPCMATNVCWPYVEIEVR